MWLPILNIAKLIFVRWWFDPYRLVWCQNFLIKNTLNLHLSQNKRLSFQFHSAKTVSLLSHLNVEKPRGAYLSPTRCFKVTIVHSLAFREQSTAADQQKIFVCLLQPRLEYRMMLSWKWTKSMMTSRRQILLWWLVQTTLWIPLPRTIPILWSRACLFWKCGKRNR